jgi:hypothetical protein
MKSPFMLQNMQDNFLIMPIFRFGPEFTCTFCNIALEKEEFADLSCTFYTILNRRAKDGPCKPDQRLRLDME